MWKVRCIGLCDSGFDFLQKIQNGKFSSVVHGNYTEHFISISDINTKDARKILTLAKEELKIYKGLLKINDFAVDISVDIAIDIKEDGSEISHLFFEDRISISDNYDIYIDDELHYSSKQAHLEKNKAIFNNVALSPKKQKLLILLGCEENWGNAYKIFEILKDDTNIREYRIFKYFSHTANSPDAIGIDNARHGVQSHNSPKDITDLKVAYQKLVELSLNYIKSDKTG